MNKPKNFETGTQDRLTGATWVHVAPELARNHAQGKLNALLWAIVVAIAIGGGSKIAAFTAGGALFWLFGGLFQLLTAWLLAIRAPWAVVIVGAQLIISLISLAISLQESVSLFKMIELGFSIAVLSYLIEGDRPNLIYRHRYRSFREK